MTVRPFSGGKHQFMTRRDVVLTIPNPQRRFSLRDASLKSLSDDVVAIKNRACLVAGHPHGNGIGHAGQDEVRTACARIAGRAPDLGAYEVGQAPVIYGPRGRTGTRPFYW